MAAKSEFTDEQILDAYEKYGCVEGARHLGMKNLSNREKRIKDRGCTKEAQAALFADRGTREEKHRFRGGNSIDELYQNHSIVPENVTLKSARIAEHGVVITDKKTGVQRLDVSYLKSSSFVPKEEIPRWPVVQPANQADIIYTPREPSPTPSAQRVFLWPDTQIGFYRSTATGELTPMHDLKAIDVALQMLHAFRPDRVVILGDLIDLAGLSRWLQLAEFQHTLQPAIQYTYMLLAKMRAIVGPKCEIDYIAGNHERRFSEYIAKNALAAHGLRLPEKDFRLVDPLTLMPKTWDWPVLSIPNVLRLKELGITYSAEYPGGEVWIGKRNVCTHPPEKTTKREIRANVYNGHIPYVQEIGRTIHRHPDDGPQEFTQVNVPGLMRTDDVTDKSSLSRSSTTSSMARMNWQQGIGTLLIFDEEHEKYETGLIKDGWGCLGERQFRSSVDGNGNPVV